MWVKWLCSTPWLESMYLVCRLLNVFLVWGFCGSNIVLELRASSSVMEMLNCVVWCAAWALTENQGNFLLCSWQFCLWMMNCVTSWPGYGLMRVLFFALLRGDHSAVLQTVPYSSRSCWLPKATSVKWGGTSAYLLNCENSRKIDNFSWVLLLLLF